MSSPAVQWWAVSKPCPSCGVSVDWPDRRGPADAAPKIACPECEGMVQVHDYRDTLPGEDAEVTRPVH